MEREMRTVIRNEPIDMQEFYASLPAYVQEHCHSVGKLAGRLFALAVAAGLDSDLHLTQEQMSWAACYHDIGLALLPERLLLKCEELSGAEERIYQRHALYGGKLLEDYGKVHPPVPGEPVNPWGVAAEIALSHHENWDGTGYPYGQMATAIPFAARITAIACCYDNYMRGNNARMAMPQEYALLEIIQNAGKAYDPQLVEIFRRQMLP